MRRDKQARKVASELTSFAEAGAAAAWRRAAASRATYLAAATTRLLDLTHVGAGARVLAVGVGTGEEAMDIAERTGPTGEIVAIDISDAMIAEARRVATHVGLTGVRFLIMDAQRLDFAAETFDAVISRNALMFIPDLSVALAEMARVLKPSGRIGATVWSTGRRNPRLFGPVEAARALGAIPPPSATLRVALRLGTPSLLRSALRDAGFRDVSVERLAVIAHFKTLDEAVLQALEHPGTQELLRLLAPGSETRMRRSLERRWRRYVGEARVGLPGEQVVFAGTKEGDSWPT